MPSLLEKRMAETAEALLDQDERLHIRPSQEMIALPAPDSVQLRPRQKPATLDWHRLVYYALGGVGGLIFLLLLAERINPPDSALRDQAIARVLAPWDGEWKGTLARLDLHGRLIGHVEARREYISSNSTYQTATFTTTTDSETRSEAWVNKVLDETRLLSVRTDAETVSSPYEGTIEGGRLIFVRRNPEGTEILRSRITGTTLEVDETFIPVAADQAGWMLTGTLERVIPRR